MISGYLYLLNLERTAGGDEWGPRQPCCMPSSAACQIHKPEAKIKIISVRSELQCAIYMHAQE